MVRSKEEGGKDGYDSDLVGTCSCTRQASSSY